MNDKDLEALNELNKGCSMGIDSLNDILEKANEKKFKKLISNLLDKYDVLSNEINDLYNEVTEHDAKDTSDMSKMMTWYGIEIRTLMDSSDSKLSELIMQGLNMGIIEGRKYLNEEGIDNRITSLLKEYIDMQEEYVEKFKKYL